jgi:hypothetical protein
MNRESRLQEISLEIDKLITERKLRNCIYESLDWLNIDEIEKIVKEELKMRLHDLQR